MEFEITKEILRDIRLAAGLTQEDAASLVHLGSKKRWMEYEKGVKKPDPAKVELFFVKVAMQFEVSLDRVLYRQGGIKWLTELLLSRKLNVENKERVRNGSGVGQKTAKNQNRGAKMNTLQKFKQEISNIPADLLALAAEDSKNANHSGFAPLKNKKVVDFASALSKQISLSKLDHTQKDRLIVMLNSKLYPAEFPADGRLNTKTGLGQLFQAALNS